MSARSGRHVHQSLRNRCADHSVACDRQSRIETGPIVSPAAIGMICVVPRRCAVSDIRVADVIESAAIDKACRQQDLVEPVVHPATSTRVLRVNELKVHIIIPTSGAVDRVEKSSGVIALRRDKFLIARLGGSLNIRIAAHQEIPSCG